ncbi:hypothetical protein COCMIDRAFT_33925 [Bipolaris oryzae ATCC 44560]|uniref:AB hydrolase-1 domain-containing protein n=1 Tax=Bipolaris oryzae ATCC 44560 TaxID=930090 RepID=W6ZXN4_COCMI|nr:uncharacterized protein COCMIDRAFT_33925 [Bipolaris oryzae ATCC 44560]EUC48646.1 hypothetical protein COCMIDRAFT_33925 [Bipolaris oryzae ATCC 44560]
MSSRPTVVLVPGSFCSANAYDVIVTPLRSKGYDIQVIEPPCYPAGYGRKSDGPPPNMYADAQYINKHVEKLADEGKEVVLVAHSYGGVPATQSLKGVTKKEREQQGKPGGVVRIAYLTALVPRLGETSFQVLGDQGGVVPSAGEDGWMYHADPAPVAAQVCSDIPLADAIVEVSKMGRHFGACFLDPLTHMGYKDVPASWFFCGKDLVVTPDAQQKGIEAIEESWVGTEREGKKVDVTRLECDHYPLVLEDRRAKVEAWVEGLVEKGGRD